MSALEKVRHAVGLAVALIIAGAAIVYNRTHVGTWGGVTYAGDRYSWLPDHLWVVDAIVTGSEIVIYVVVAWVLIALVARHVLG